MRATLTIDLEAIAANWRALDAMTDCETGAVVKANAYGLGVAHVAPALWEAGARTFFVALAEEGVELRRVLGPEARIFVFSGHMLGDRVMISTCDLIPLLNSLDQIARFRERLPGRKYGLQLDTGMNRLGLEIAELAEAGELKPELVISHLACADDPEHPQNAAQLAAFDVAKQFNARRSLAATGGVLLGNQYHLDITRPGIGLYGGLPFADAQPVVTLSLPVIQEREVAIGESVGYGATWVAERPSFIATVSAGYADGLIRAMGNKAMLYAGDVACPVVGRVSMDLITVDVTDLRETPDELDILNAYQTVDTLAEAAGTIGYEILTSLGARYERRYIGG